MRQFIFAFFIMAIPILLHAAGTVPGLFCMQASDANEKSGLQISQLNLDDGLSNDFVTAITQDKHGFLWIATETGLNRFDGIRFKTFTEKDTPLKGNSINALLYDETSDNLWIGSKKGLNILNCENLQWEDPKLPECKGRMNIVGFAKADNGGIFILNHYDYFLYFNPSDKSFTTLSKKDFPGLYPSFLSIACSRGLIYIGHENQGISILDPKSGKVDNIRKDNTSGSLPGNDVRAITIDRHNNIWVGTNVGAALFNPSNRRFIPLARRHSVSGKAVRDNVYAITETDDGQLWIGSDFGGVFIIDTNNLSIVNPDRYTAVCLPILSGQHTLSSPSVRSIFQDCFGNIWIGNYSEGLDFISKYPPKFNRLPYFHTENMPGRTKPVYSLLRDGDNVWIGSENEIVCLNKGRIIKTYDISSSVRNGKSYVYALAKFNGKIIVSSYDDGILSINPATSAIERLPMPFDNDYANCFYVESDSLMYMGTQHGIHRLEHGEITFDRKLSDTMNHLVANGILADDNGNLWIGSYGDGVYVFDKDKNLVANIGENTGLISNAVKQLFKDSSGKIWVAGQDGLACINDASDPAGIVNIGYDHGLPEIHIRSIQEDNIGNIWICTDNNLIKRNMKTGKMKFFNYRDGLPKGNFMDRAACKDSDGNLYFASAKGVCLFNPSDILMANTAMQVKITDLQILSDIDNNSDQSVMPFMSKGKISVPFSRNSLKVFFSSPDFSLSPMAEYTYKLEGIDKGWSMADEEHCVTLRNLSPGSYVLNVKARLRNYDWDENGMATLSIIVMPPLWLTWYAKLFYVVVILTLAYFAFRLYRNRIRLNNTLEMERRKSIDDQQLNNERLRFFTNITHELRTPLTLIIGPLEDLVADNRLPAEYSSKINTIHASATGLLNLVNQLLEFRKTETRNRRLAVSRGQIKDIVNEIGLRYKELNNNDKVAINLDIDENIPDIYFDSDIIHTILNNLLSNAVKYTPKGSIDLSLREISFEEERYVEISVADTGYGIEEKDLPRIFERFYQAEGKHQASGSGIGLALVHSLADLHEGTLSVESQPGKGTTFRFRLGTDNNYPDALHKDKEAIMSEKGNNLLDDSKEDCMPLVMIVEDNTEIREYIASFLKSHHRVITASDGQEGLELAKRYIPDIIVSDIMMPVMDGLELCRTVKDNIATSHIPVILLTAKDSIRDKEAGYENGADSYITKPFSGKLIESRINNILEAHKKLARIISGRINEVPKESEAEVNAIDAANLETSASVETPDSSESSKPLEITISKIDMEFLDKFTRIVEENISDTKLDMNFMQKAMNMSHSTLYRKMKSLTGMSGNEFIRKIKIKKGACMLMEGHNVSETAYACGLDPSYFRNCFKEEYGIPPSQYRKSLTISNLANGGG